MRPLLLEIEGLTSFREKVTLDFAQLDLFAITGPTGAGKSSLVDGLIWALFGQVPRVGKEYRQLLSHGAERLTVRLDFAVGSESYRVVRTLSGAGRLQVRLEHLRPGGATPLADRASEVAASIERLIGLDYAGFTRAVVLPQGQFDQFLRGDAADRRAILVSLLNLRVYERMAALARGRAAQAKTESDYIAAQLGRDFSAATPEALAALRDEAARLAVEDRRLAEEQAALAEAVVDARRLSDATRELQRLTREGDAARGEEAAARQVIDAASATRAADERALAEARTALEATPFAEDRLLLLTEAKPRAEQLAALVAEQQRLAQRLVQEERQLAQLGTQGDEARRGLEEQEQRLRAAEEHRARALAEREEFRRRHAAHELRRDLVTGAPCPVCEQVVTVVPPGEPVGLEQADGAVAEAETWREAARGAREAARVRLTRLETEHTHAAAGLTRTATQASEAESHRAALLHGLEALGYEPDNLVDAPRLIERLRVETLRLADARSRRERLATEVRRLEGDLARGATTAATAAAQLDAATRRLGELATRRAAAQSEVERLEGALRARGAAGQPALAAPGPRETWLEALEGRLTERQRQATGLAAALARVTTQIEGLERALTRVAELRERQRALQSVGEVANALARALQADQFLAFVQGEALRRLAEDGSERLQKLSLGRYALLCQAEEFFVVDHWNADTERSVKTLSGGETFLASLALALALADRLAELSAEGRAQETLESLFLDEGFGTLDAETLDVVVSGLEALQGGRRMVGVITHLEALAERLPARVTVVKAERGATLRLS